MTGFGTTIRQGRVVSALHRLGLPEEMAAPGLGLDVSDPYTRTRVASVPVTGDTALAPVIDTAWDSFQSWSRAPAAQRAHVLTRWARLLEDHSDALADLIAIEQGKPLEQARREVVGAVAYAGLYAEEARRAYGDIIPGPWRDKRILVQQKPVGPVAALTPWNFPLTMVVRKCAPALAAGCSVIVKPSEHTPLSAFAAGALARQAGLPQGVMQVVAGDAPALTGRLLHTGKIRKVSFTGSTRVGKLLYAQAALRVKNLSLELGGNAPFIVFDDADLARAVSSAMVAKFRNGGQTCVSANRFLIQAGIYQNFIGAFRDAMTSLHPGDAFAPDVDYGPAIDSGAKHRIENLVAEAITQGAKRLLSVGPDDGQMIPAQLLTQINPHMRIVTEELFAPIAPVLRFQTEAEAIALANQSPAGLSAYVHTTDLGRAWRLSEALATGVVGVNEGATSNEMAPFGGIHESGQGREGGYQGLAAYLEPQYQLIGLS